MGKAWTPEQIDALRSRIVAGATMAQLAVEYNKTPAAMNATIVRFRKLYGLPALSRVVPTPPPEPPPTPPEPPPEPVSEPEPPPEPTNYATLLDRTGCCWPVEGAAEHTLFCNAARLPKSSYCAAHARAGYHSLGRSGKPFVIFQKQLGNVK